MKPVAKRGRAVDRKVWPESLYDEFVRAQDAISGGFTDEYDWSLVGHSLHLALEEITKT